jgi:prepilin-type N-terminal cleavage/methylation domain-containing protein
MYLTRKREAFTLIELLTVMAIITLLIGILTPALTTARDQARKTAVKAQINAMEVGLEAFHQDEGKYVPSNPVYYSSDLINAGPIGTAMTNWEVGTLSAPLSGANLLLDALVGRDFLGYDAKAPPFNTGGQGNPPYDRWAPKNDRRQPYIPVDGIDVTSADRPPEDGLGDSVIMDPLKTQPTIQGPTGDPMLCRVFRDKFGWPILYYRASPSANQNTAIVTTTTNTHPTYGDGVYDGKDNELFTSYNGTNPNSTTNKVHKICDAPTAMAVTSGPTTPYPTPLDNRFAEFIRSIRASTYNNVTPPAAPQILQPRPVKSDRFILLSAGKDGIYGTLDDVANFNVLSDER